MKRISTLLFCICACPLAYAIEVGVETPVESIDIPIKVVLDPCVLDKPTLTTPTVNVNELRTGKTGSVDLTFTGCTVGEKIDIKATATTSKTGSINAYLATKEGDLGTSNSNELTFTDVVTQSSSTTTPLHYVIKSGNDAKATDLVGDTTISIALTYTYK